MTMSAQLAVEGDAGLKGRVGVRGAGRASTLRWVFIIGLLAFLIAPIIPLILWSFSFRWTFPNLLPTEYSMRAWEAVASPTNDVLVATWNSTVIAVVVTALSILIGVPAGRALGLYKFPG